jgi:hypothetical protein
VVVVTDATPEHPSEATAAGASPPRWDGRWDKSRRRGGPFRLAAVVVTLAGIVFIVAVIFWSGFILGACEGGGGGHQHGHGGGGSWHHNGMAHYGVVIELAVPSAGVPGSVVVAS